MAMNGKMPGLCSGNAAEYISGKHMNATARYLPSHRATVGLYLVPFQILSGTSRTFNEKRNYVNDRPLVKICGTFRANLLAAAVVSARSVRHRFIRVLPLAWNQR